MSQLTVALCTHNPRKEFIEETLSALRAQTLAPSEWTLLVIEELGSGGEMRFTQLRHRIGCVSQKMLTKTLRELERDGLVTRRVHPVVPPRVDYKLTALGEALGEAVCGIWTWVEKHLKDVERSRQAYDRRESTRETRE